MVLYQTVCEQKDLRMHTEDYDQFASQTRCEICGVSFDGFSPPYMDHDHDTGKYRMALCNRCNLTYASEKLLKIVCFGHYASHYDQHLFINELVADNKKRGKKTPRILPHNTEHFKAIYDDIFIFLDSCEFLQSSLSSIVESMKISSGGTDKEVFPLLSEFLCHDMSKYELLMKKGVFCYEYLDDETKLLETSLPDKDLFFDKLKNRSISQAEYDHAQTVWKRMCCRDIGDYLSVYLATDVMLLADCMEAFRKMCYERFRLDPARYLSLPHFAWHSMLLFTGAKLDLVPSPDMYFFIKRGIRGGVASIMHRLVEDVNIPEMGKLYNSEKPRKEIAAFDCVNLYGLALCRALPKGNFRWLTAEEIRNFTTEQINDVSKVGYILSVDLDYPDKLHDLHDMLPFCPEKTCIPPAEWSEYTLRQGLALNDTKSTEKLIPHLKKRIDYVIHGEHLKYCLKKGLVLKKIRRILAFDQDRWLAPFINFVTDCRKAAATEFESSVWKRMINATYGRLLMDKEKCVNLKLVDSQSKFLKESKKTNLKSLTFYNPKLVGVQLTPQRFVLDKPIAVGFACLELSKLHIYKFHYGYILPTYGKDCQLLVTDTDSLIYSISNHNVDEEIWANRHYFDLSNYPKDSPMYWEENRKLRGTFKREYPDRPIVGFVGLRAKMYAFKHLGEDDETQKAKGINKAVLKLLRFNDYKNALLGSAGNHRHRFRSIRSKKLELYTVEQEKRGLSAFDTKRWICEDGVHTLAYGNWNIGCQAADF